MRRMRSVCRAALVFAALVGVLPGGLVSFSSRPGKADERSSRSDSPREVRPVTDEKWTVERYVIAKGQKPEPADNSYCDVCHVNYQEEELTEVHREVGVGCETCHGISMQHSEDENNITPPDVMWAPARINGRCMTCHLRSDILPGSKAINHQSFFDRLDRADTAKPGEKYCTECHAEDHTLAHRTRVWDRETGKLLKQTGGPAMDR